MDLQFKNKNDNNLKVGDKCKFFWNPILNEPSLIFEFEQEIEYIPEFASYGFCLKSKTGEIKNVSLWAVSEFTDFGVELVKNSR